MTASHAQKIGDGKTGGFGMPSSIKKEGYINTKAEFDKLISSTGSKLLVVDFTASWCPPC